MIDRVAALLADVSGVHVYEGPPGELFVEVAYDAASHDASPSAHADADAITRKLASAAVLVEGFHLTRRDKGAVMVMRFRLVD